MKKVMTASTSEVVIATVQKACEKFSNYFDLVVLKDTEQVINYIDYELPEIKVLDFSDNGIDANRILSIIDDDAWLHYGGIIAVCKNSDQVLEIEAKKNANIIAVQTKKEFNQYFLRLLRILWQNQHFLFNRGIQDVIGGQESGSFVCSNNHIDIRFYTNFLVSYLYNTNRITDDDRFRLQMSMTELLTNALEHGNLEISYSDKTKWLEQGKDILELLKDRAQQPEYVNRKINISYHIGKTTSRFTITDDGKGFDWRKFTENKNSSSFKAETDFSEALHGRGIALSLEMIENLTYNDKGNQVSFEIKNLMNTANTVPGIMNSFETISYEDKQIVCRENEMSNDLFFIVSGRFAVYSGKKLVSVLTPNDMFIGEMAFLLNDRRSATVLSIGDCRLIKIPKGAFLSLIRKNPHYGIFLSKMLAQRLQRQTQATIKLKNELMRKNNG